MSSSDECPCTPDCECKEQPYRIEIGIDVHCTSKDVWYLAHDLADKVEGKVISISDKDWKEI